MSSHLPDTDEDRNHPKKTQAKEKESSYSEYASFDVILCVLLVVHTFFASDASSFSGMTCRERR